ncbi:MAG: hypothetical protein QOK15_2853 [Nocardioidaceae bacterium]|nr:hypothetical protein [Nocardioidaceae bacterium]
MPSSEASRRPSPLSRVLRLGVPLTCVVALLTGVSTAAPAAADARVMPGDFTGYAFDACDTPSQRRMDAWRRHSKFWGVGVYVAGMNRACSTQRHLTRTWVATQERKGWRILPLVVGRQASCAPKGYYRGKRISANPRHDYGKARAQGRAAADSGVDAAHRLGISSGSVLWFDLENFDSTRTRCRRSAERFVAGWTQRLHGRHFRAGLYSSASSGIAASDAARRAGITVPDYLWIAEWNGDDNLRSSYISRAGWWPHRRVHQYRGGHDERHGGVRINIDSNYMSTGRGTVEGRAARPCDLRVSFASYSRLERGDRGRLVRAAQCLLRRQKTYAGKLTGRLDRGTQHAVVRFQRHHSLAGTGVLNRRTWTALLSTGGRPLLKYGAGGNAVRRFQRALNAASDAGLRVDGVFAGDEMRVVKQLQRRHSQPGTGVVTPKTWRLLQRGQLAGRIRHRSGGHSSVDGLPGIGPVPFGIGAAGPSGPR